jgi:hypothetical protein
MKSFVSAVLFAVIVAVGANMVLTRQASTSDAAFATSGARVGDPGYNLIGK